MAIAITEDNPKIRSFLEAHNVGILATCTNDGVPHAATIYFVTDADFVLYFVTRAQTTKHRNIEQNSRVALAVYDAVTQTTVQIVGTAARVEGVDKVAELSQRIAGVAQGLSPGHTPPVTKIDAGEYVAYRIQPQSLRMAEYVKAEYPPVDQLFEVVTIPDGELK